MKTEGDWICAQLGAREHYAIPRALHSVGSLDIFFTDYWGGYITRAFAKQFATKTARSLATRFHVDLPKNLIRSNNLRALGWEARLRQLSHRHGVAGRYLGYCEVGKSFAKAVVRSIKALRSVPDHSVFIGYDTCSLEIMEHLKNRGVACILDQIDPCRAEIEMVKAEQELWPGWEDEALEVPAEFYERHVREWQLADRVMVNSDFCRAAIIAQGVPIEKIAVVPLSLENQSPYPMAKLEASMMPSAEASRRFSETAPLRVLFLGQVMLRKGIQYLMEAAKLLVAYPVVFDVVGPIHVSKKAIASAPGNLVFHGRATRDEIERWYQNADVFVLPTLSDGFAITQIEAMANGLPVIATPNCGVVVCDGANGFLVPPRDSTALATIVCRYLEDPDCLLRQSRAALETSRQFSLSRLAHSLQDIGREIRTRK